MSPSDEPQAYCVPPTQVHLLWPIAAALIRKAETPRTPFRQVEMNVLAGVARLWVVCSDEFGIEAAAVVTIVNVDGRRTYELTALGGVDMYRWLMLQSAIEQHARDEGCKAIRINGRYGWKRILGDFEHLYSVFEKAL